MNDFFYRAFEDRFRGSRSLISARLVVYQPFLRPLAVAFQTPKALDLGCGRGEWLEVLAGAGFDAWGVDLNEGMLAACQERGLTGQLGDALSTLKELPSESLALVSAFHLVPGHSGIPRQPAPSPHQQTRASGVQPAATTAAVFSVVTPWDPPRGRIGS